jgi:hypothetical protein
MNRAGVSGRRKKHDQKRRHADSFDCVHSFSPVKLEGIRLAENAEAACSACDPRLIFEGDLITVLRAGDYRRITHTAAG